MQITTNFVLLIVLVSMQCDFSEAGKKVEVYISEYETLEEYAASTKCRGTLENNPMKNATDDVLKTKFPALSAEDREKISKGGHCIQFKEAVPTSFKTAMIEKGIRYTAPEDTKPMITNTKSFLHLEENGRLYYASTQ